MVIRGCRESDLDALEWDGQFAHDRAVIRSTFAHTRRGTMLMLVAEHRGAHVGQAWIDLRRAPRTAVVWALRVKPSWQGRGIATRLLARCERAIAARSLHVAELEVEPANTEARRLYEKAGYIHVRSELARDDAGAIGRGFDVLAKPLSPRLSATTVRMSRGPACRTSCSRSSDTSGSDRPC